MGWAVHMNGHSRLVNAMLGDMGKAPDGTRARLTYIRDNEQAVLERTSGAMAPYMPKTGPMQLKAYLMNGGTSTGFARTTAEGDAFFNLADAARHCEGAMSFITHELFHLVQKAALRRVPALAATADLESLPVPERTLASVVNEGTADLVSDPERFGGGAAPSSRCSASASAAKPSPGASARSSRSLTPPSSRPSAVRSTGGRLRTEVSIATLASMAWPGRCGTCRQECPLAGA